ncbi:MAG: DnaJ domain-containing protein, partial [Hydrogenophaga sp.]
MLSTLKSFQEGPGRYAVVLREPRLLFDHPMAVMQLAAGRELLEFATAPGPLLAAARQAARFFVRFVMLAPGSDHYALLGLTPGFLPTQLREHYRLMIRLTHPDFAAPGDTWPKDAAARINIANDVLGSDVKRGAYHAQWAAAPKPAGSASAMATNGKAGGKPGPTAAGANSGRSMPSVVPRRLAPGAAPASAWANGLSLQHKIGMAAGGALLVAGLLVWLNGTVEDKGSLRVRAPQDLAAPSSLNLLPSAELAVVAPPESSARPVAVPAFATRPAPSPSPSPSLALAPKVAQTPPAVRREAVKERASSAPAATATVNATVTAAANTAAANAVGTTVKATEPVAPVETRAVSDWVFPRVAEVAPVAAGNAPPTPSAPSAPAPPAPQPTPEALPQTSPPEPP